MIWDVEEVEEPDILEKSTKEITVSIDDIEKARGRIAGSVLRTPLVRLNYDEAPCEVYLKLECLQPTGSFKVRGAGNAVSLIPHEQRARGVYTCSAGNMAQALAWHARREGIPCTAIVPDNAPETKIAAIERYGAKIIKLSWDGVWEVATNHYYQPLSESTFVHPFADPAMIAGNGTAGLEILEDLHDVDAVIVPFGGGGLFTGIATAIKAKKKDTRMFASEVETSPPLSAAIEKGQPTDVNRLPSFVDGIGAKNVLPEMWSIAKPLVDGSIVVSLSDTARSIRLLIERNRVVAEGASGTSVAAALSGGVKGAKKVVSVVSGGNIDTTKIVKILSGEVP